MDEVVIQCHDFEAAKEEIKRFSEETITDLSLNHVNDKKEVLEWLWDAIFGRDLGTEHIVTGGELNEVTRQIQKHLEAINNTQNKLVREFGQVVNTFEILDRDYIQAILTALNATKETSKAIADAQERISKLVYDQERTLKVLQKFKERLDGYSHLGDIDTIWNNCQQWYEKCTALAIEIENIGEDVKNNSDKIDEAFERILTLDINTNDLNAKSQQQDSIIKELKDYIIALQEYKHLSDIDDMWLMLSNVNATVEKILEELISFKVSQEAQAGDIKKLFSFKEMLEKNEHILEIDSLWESNETHSTAIMKLQDSSDATNGLIQKNRELSVQENDELRRQYNEALSCINRKIKYAYWAAGSAIGIAIFELIFIAIKVL